MLLDVVRRERHFTQDVMGIILSSPVAKNIFLGFPEYKRYDFIRQTHTMFGVEEPLASLTRLVLSQKPYAPYLLV